MHEPGEVLSHSQGVGQIRRRRLLTGSVRREEFRPAAAAAAATAAAAPALCCKWYGTLGRGASTLVWCRPSEYSIGSPANVSEVRAVLRT